MSLVELTLLSTTLFGWLKLKDVITDGPRLMIGGAPVVSERLPADDNNRGLTFDVRDNLSLPNSKRPFAY